MRQNARMQGQRLMSNTPRSSRACGNCKEAVLELRARSTLLFGVPPIPRRDSLILLQQKTSALEFVSSEERADARQQRQSLAAGDVVGVARGMVFLRAHLSCNAASADGGSDICQERQLSATDAHDRSAIFASMSSRVFMTIALWELVKLALGSMNYGQERATRKTQRLRVYEDSPTTLN